jgi:hypothetical protein
MPSDGTLKGGTAISLDIPLDLVVYDGFLFGHSSQPRALGVTSQIVFS